MWESMTTGRNALRVWVLRDDDDLGWWPIVKYCHR